MELRLISFTNKQLVVKVLYVKGTLKTKKLIKTEMIY